MLEIIRRRRLINNNFYANFKNFVHLSTGIADDELDQHSGCRLRVNVPR